jgi:signal transduction histidine kinase/HAMP domain-containing protein
VRFARRKLFIHGSLRRQAIQLVTTLCLLIVICASVIVVAIAGDLSAGRNLTQLNQAQLLARGVAADQAAGSDALRALALHPTRPDYLSVFVGRQVQLESDVQSLNAMPLPSELRASRASLSVASTAWLQWAGDQASRIQDGNAQVDDAGNAVRQEIADAARDFNYQARLLEGQAQDVVNLTSALVVGSTAGGVLIGLAGLTLLAWQFFRLNLRPMERLAIAAGELAAGRPAVITPVEGTTELLALATALEQWHRSMESRIALAEATLRMSGQVEFEQLLSVGGSLADALDAEVIGFYLDHRDDMTTQHLYVRSSHTLTLALAPPPDSPSLQASRTGLTVCSDLNDPELDPMIREFATANHLGAALAVQMVSGGRAVGTVTFARLDDRPAFSKADVQLAEFSVAHVAAAIHVVELLGDLTDANAGLELANQHKSEFLAHMSHELRTPLNSILGFAQLLDDQSFGALSERQARYVSHIRSSGDHLLSLINDILDLSKVEAGQLDLMVETVGLSALLDDCVGDIRPLADAKKLDLRFRASSALLVRADRRRLAQVILNLLSNAIKFTPEDGRITVNASADDDGVVIAVRDTGIGIAASEQQNIFDAFFQIRGGRTRQQEGTGLGLALSRRMMELMGGSLSVVSREGRGSTFSVRIPRAATARAEAELVASGA